MPAPERGGESLHAVPTLGSASLPQGRRPPAHLPSPPAGFDCPSGRQTAYCPKLVRISSVPVRQCASAPGTLRRFALSSFLSSLLLFLPRVRGSLGWWSSNLHFAPVASPHPPDPGVCAPFGVPSVLIGCWQLFTAGVRRACPRCYPGLGLQSEATLAIPMLSIVHSPGSTPACGRKTALCPSSFLSHFLFLCPAGLAASVAVRCSTASGVGVARLFFCPFEQPPTTNHTRAPASPLATDPWPSST